MATRVFNEETLELQDGTKVVIRPLNIKRLRRFMDVVDEMQATENATNNDQLDAMVRACAIAIGQKQPELEDDTDHLEEILDMDTIYKIFEVAGNIKLNDPNVQAALVEQLGKS